jgi:hypothetical protein
MKKDFRIIPIGLKGNEINERMKELMGITPINENISRSVVELTKIGPDGKAYAIVRENHEYFIKVSNKTSKLVTEDFKYIGGLQNKKQEAYPSYAKATKHLNLTFKSLAEAYGTDSNINVFEDDDLLNEENFAAKHIVDKKGDELKKDVKEGSEEDGFGDNVATGKTMKEFEKVKMNEDIAGFSQMEGNGFMKEGMFGEDDDLDMSEEEQYIDSMLEGDDFYKTDAEDQIPNPPSEFNYKVDKGNDFYKTGAEDQIPNLPSELHIPTEGYMEEDYMEEDYMEEGTYEEGYMGQEEDDMSTDELMDRLDNMSAAELLQLLGDAGRDLKRVISQKLSTGMDKARNYFDRQNEDIYEEMSPKDKKFAALAEPKDKITYADKIAGATKNEEMSIEEEEEMSDKDKKFAALAEPRNKITYADKIAGATKNEEMTLEEIQEAIAYLKKKL